MLRTRDLFAAIGILWLTKSAYYNNNNDSSNNNNISANLHLAFYLPQRSGNLFPEVFDVDGDGTPEALAVITNETLSSSSSAPSWKIQILDLRRSVLQSSRLAPFQPRKLLESSDVDAVHGEAAAIRNKINDKQVVIPFQPLQLTTGQVFKSNASKPQDTEKRGNNKDSNSADKTDKFFCGVDWHDAANKCATHCPSGQSSDCPNNERCFADTPCSAAAQNALSAADHYKYDNLHTTPAGGWPSIFTVFSQGLVTMHSLTASQQDDKQNKNAKLQVKLMWQVNPFNITKSATGTAAMEWEDVAVTFVDAISAGDYHHDSDNAGLLIVAGTATAYYQPNDNEDDDDDDATRSAEFVIALDALTGSTLWQSLSEDLQQHHDANGTAQTAVPLPVVASTRGTSSAARRRSLIPQHTVGAKKEKSTTGVAAANCMREYRHSLLTSAGGALPHQYWGSADDAVVTALHFDHQGSGGSSVHSKTKKKTSTKKGKPAMATTHSGRRTPASQLSSHDRRWWRNLFPFGSKMSLHKRRHRDMLLLGRPNVIVTHNYEGIQVRALKNGRSLCHLSLQDQTAYADINHDGNLDSLQIITSSSKTIVADDDEDDAIANERQWVANLARRVTDLNQQHHQSKTSSKNDLQTPQQRLANKSSLCHLLALSGLPTKEELFSVNLCGRYGFQQQQQQHDIVGAPLLIVEPSIRGSRTGHDVVAAVNTGMVSRVRGTSGRRIFQENGRHHSSDFPVWDRPENVLLQRIDSENVTPYTRPIVLAGENSVVLLSALNGHLLASATFAQPSRTRPRLVDFNGDGTTDLLVSTTDAVWGYQIAVHTGASVFFRIIHGLLIMGLMLAVVRNKFGPHPGKRSTDI